MKMWLILATAVLTEVFGTSMLKASKGFTKLYPTIGVIIGYSASFYLLSLTLKALPVGISYAVWSGVGTVLITLISWLYFKQHLDWAAILGMILIVSGVLIMNLFSKSVGH